MDYAVGMRKAFRKIKNFVAGSPARAAAYLDYSKPLIEYRITEQYLVVSFDCDTPDDARAAGAIAEWFRERGIPAVFAVPGRSIEGAEAAYTSIAKSGFEFLNHGYAEHAAYDVERERYYSITFYDKMAAEQIRQDIIDGDTCIRRYLGLTPLGFRAPHFGSFQKKEQLEIIYTTLSKLGYSYATTTMPEYGLRKGALFQAYNGIIEFPLTGTYDNPHVILDSWQFLAAPQRVYTADDYVNQFRKMVDFFSGRDLPCILNYYVDPIHVIDFEGFFGCVEYALQRGLKAATYSQILSRLNVDR
jgi:peptidoglycan/xylan/chitin deacetylase (PgdA/CDA1 family)